MFSYDNEWFNLDKAIDDLYDALEKEAIRNVSSAKTISDIRKSRKEYKKKIKRLQVEKEPFIYDMIKNATISFNNDFNSKPYLDLVDALTKKIDSTIDKSYKGYVKLTNQLITKIEKGDISISQGAKEFKELINEQGTYRVVTQSGRRYEPRGYFKMLSRTEYNIKHSNHVMRFALTYGDDVIQVSKHTHRKPRELCAPEENKLISITGKTKEFVDGNGTKHIVYALNETTYGQPAGIFGINCTHTMRIMTEGVSIP